MLFDINQPNRTATLSFMIGTYFAESLFELASPINPIQAAYFGSAAIAFFTVSLISRYPQTRAITKPIGFGAGLLVL